MSSPKLGGGVVALFIDEAGRVIAQVADFDRTGYGGYTLQEAQSLRARDRLALEVCHAYASPQLCRAIDSFRANHIVDELVRNHGCKIQVIDIEIEQ